MLRDKCLSVFFVLAWSLAAVAQADTIGIPVPNGDFSSPATNGYVLGAPTSWTDTMPDGSGVSVYGSIGGGSDQFFFQGIGAYNIAYLYQIDIGANFVVGDTYQLDFDYANGQTGPYSLTANITYNAGNSATAQQVFTVAPNQAWTHGSISGVATSSSTGPIGIVFKFETGEGAYQPWLDNVAITQTSPIPEPATGALAGLGLLGLLAYAWRKRR
jgi:hypothetical protein